MAIDLQTQVLYEIGPVQLVVLGIELEMIEELQHLI